MVKSQEKPAVSNLPSEAEIAKFVDMGKRMASKAVLTALIYVVNDGIALGKSASSAEKLAKKIAAAIPYDYSGFLSIRFHEIPDITLNACLSLVERNYKVNAMVPHESYAKDLYQQYEVIRQVATTYWLYFAKQNSNLIKEITEYRNDIDFSELRIDAENPTTMYFDAACAKRVGIFVYYTDKDGNPYNKRN